ncbi:unnamed protein product [Absidia cylindrospora]
MVETNVFFGTAFPQQTEKDKRLGATDSGQFLPAWKQEARDEQGRRRFHGAFTGGFSAGYFNTVGSKEGWTPSQFVSSRSSRGQQKAAQVEDFMDEEDLQALASTKRLVTTDEFDGLSGTEKEIEKRRQQQLDEDAKRGGGGDMSFLTSSLMNLVAPTQDSTGMRLLRKMGWRPGQGVGPRTAFVNDDADDDSISFQQQMTLAPKDTPIVDYQPKTNTFGLGYDLVQNVPQVAEMRRFQQQQQDQLQHQHKQRPGASAAGFGIGVFDDDDDDIMLYDDEPGSSRKYHHTLYDDNEYNKEALISRETNTRKRSSSEDRNAKKARCSDGNLPLKGFHLSIQPQELGKWYPPPTVPASFDEMHTPMTTGKGGNKKKSGQEQSSSSSITIDARGAMLGEKPIEARSVFDYMSSKTKERLAQATSAASEPVVEVDKTQLQVTLIPKDVAQLALRGFIPFGDTPGKQERYRHFLEAAIAHHINHDESTTPTTNTTTFDIPVGMTHESGMKELDEFTKAARIFRPISSMMSGRFTTSSSLSPTGPPGSTNVEHVSFEGGLKTEEQWKKEKEIREKQVLDEPKPKLSQEAEAAAMDMFGQMTRTQHAFYPNRLLCKRFNVRNPHPDHVPQGPGHRTQAGSTSALDEKAMAAMLAPHHSSTTTTPPKPALADTQQNDPALRAIIAKPSSRADDSNTTTQVAATAAEEKENTDKDLDYERPAMDIFKAIFENSDDNDNDNGNDDDDRNTAATITNKNNNETLSVHSTTKNIQPTTFASAAITNQGGGDDDDFIGPPIPAPAASAPATPTSPAPMTETEKPFRPMFTKRESQDTKVHSEKIIVTPFQPRLSSTSQKRRRVSVSSDTASSLEENDSDVEKKKRRRKSTTTTSKKKKKTSDDKKRRKHHSSSRHRHHHRTNETDDDNDDKDRHHWHRPSKKDDHDSEKKSSSSSSRRRKQEDDLSLWVEKKPAPKRGRARAEDLW